MLETVERGWLLSFCTFICSLGGLGREPVVCQTLLRCWGDSDEHKDGALAPSSSLMSIGWRGVRESHEQDASWSAQAMKKTKKMRARNMATRGEQRADG